MIMRLAAVVLLSLQLTGAAVAQASPPAEPLPAPQMLGAGIATSPEDCIASATDLGRQAEAKAIPEAKLDRLDELFSKMEQHCDAKQFGEAAAVAADIKSMLDGN